MTAEELAEFFHTTYERLAPAYGYETRKESAKPWSEVPAQNKALMVAVAREVLCQIFGSQFVAWQETSEAEHEQFLITTERHRIEQTRVCDCGHPVSEHMRLPAPDETLYLLCTVAPGCGDTKFLGGVSPRCSVPAEVHSFYPGEVHS